MAKISINNMRFYAHHGCFPEEQKIGTWFAVDVTFEYDAAQAAATDNIDRAVNYLNVYQCVAKEMAIPSHLIETVATRILESIKRAFPQITEAHVRLSKLHPPLGGEIESVSVEI